MALGGFHYDKTAASMAIAFFEAALVHVKGEWAHERFRLQPWQRQIVGDTLWRAQLTGDARWRHGKSESSCAVWAGRGADIAAVTATPATGMPPPVATVPLRYSTTNR